MIVKHLYQRSMTKNGKTFKAWYFWFKDSSGKVIRKSCGTAGKPCLIKRDAMAYIESLEDEDLIPEEKKNCITIRDIAEDMYTEGSRYLIKLENRGIKFAKKTLQNKRIYLKLVLDKWGDYDPNLIDENDVENWLLEYARSGGWKNHVTKVLEDIFEELYSHKAISRIPRFKKMLAPRFSNKDIFTADEIERLFPDDFEKMVGIWAVKGEDEISAFTTGVMLYTIASLGLRNSEGRILSYNQIKGDCVLIDRQEGDDSGTVKRFLKKGSEEDPKWRLTILPEKTKKMLNELKDLRTNDSGYYFEYPGIGILSKDALNLRFKRNLKRLGFDVDNRHLTVHSLRFTYNSLVRNHIPEQMLRYMMGHTKQTMTDYYDKTDIEMRSNLLLPEKSVIDSIF